jgi:hypothetical protein
MHAHPQSPDCGADEGRPEAPQKTSGANEAESSVSPIRTENPNRSNKRPNNSDPLFEAAHPIGTRARSPSGCFCTLHSGAAT